MVMRDAELLFPQVRGWRGQPHRCSWALFCTLPSSVWVLKIIFRIAFWHFARNLGWKERSRGRRLQRLIPDTLLWIRKILGNWKRSTEKMPLLSLRQKRVAEEKGCSHNVISALCLLDLAVTRVSTALVEGKEKKTFWGHSCSLLWQVFIFSASTRSCWKQCALAQCRRWSKTHVPRYDLSKATRSYTLHPEWAGTSHVMDTIHVGTPSPLLLPIALVSFIIIIYEFQYKFLKFMSFSQWAHWFVRVFLLIFLCLAFVCQKQGCLAVTRKLAHTLLFKIFHQSKENWN